MRKNFVKLNEKECSQISGGSIIAAIAAIVTTLLTATTTVATVVKMFKADSGEVKTNTGTVK
ncbi:UNVERIFIED_CONTAM: hypothetical protein O8I53_10555 [Campylobacter lari]